MNDQQLIILALERLLQYTADADDVNLTPRQLADQHSNVHFSGYLEYYNINDVQRHLVQLAAELVRGDKEICTTKHS